jgi:competence protein ComEC
VGLLARAPAGHYYLELPRWPSGARAEMTVLDVGAGAAIHLRTRGQDWMFDAGPERTFNRIVRSYLRRRGVNRLDGLLLTHGDSQHVGAAPALLRTFRPRELLDSPPAGRSSTHRAWIELLNAKAVGRELLAARSERVISRDISARVLFPPDGFTAGSADDQALVIQLVVNGRWRVLLTSDSGLATERLLVESGVDLKSDILIKGQHHSGISGSPEFLDLVGPEMIIATSPDFPEHERVRPEWQATVEQRGIRLLRQDETGAVTLRFFPDRWDASAYTTGATFTPTRK